MLIELNSPDTRNGWFWVDNIVKFIGQNSAERYHAGAAGGIAYQQLVSVKIRY
jgi:hypothetical protein